MSSASIENGADQVADNWDDGNVEAAIQQVQEKMEKVMILKRSEQDKQMRMEKARQEEIEKLEKERIEKEHKQALGNSDEPAAPGLQIKLLRRPNSGSNMCANQGKDDTKKPAQSYEEKQEAYDAARKRILGHDYKPEPATPSTSTPSAARESRSKSPEQYTLPRFQPLMGIQFNNMPMNPQTYPIAQQQPSLAPPQFANIPRNNGHSSPQQEYQISPELLQQSTILSVQDGYICVNFKGTILRIPQPPTLQNTTDQVFIPRSRCPQVQGASMNGHDPFVPLSRCPHAQCAPISGLDQRTPSPPEEYANYLIDPAVSQMAQQMVYFDPNRPPPLVGSQTVYYSSPQPQPSPLMPAFVGAPPPLYYSSQLDNLQPHSKQGGKKKGKKK